ncbi:SemiSWEET transporter [Oscillatoria sp. CS-180]|uniref:SemiSWEET family sugar transporter n=1 Tax=Oscillatoria sp. CS-180 TaxID=3021720 RepID=UPI00232EA905|nr:SemiSWEET transporter [Oscillatoria sp. CS-180]MDB9526113.1 SemiSWEET transporter [Oscillatoria sp. CS-180]
MDLTTVLGLVAGSLTTIAYFPQVLKTWRSRSAEGMSWSMLIVLCAGIALWLIYGLYAHDAPVILANLFTLIFSSTILVMKVWYEVVPHWNVKAQVVTLNSASSETLIMPEAPMQEWCLETDIAFIPPEPEQTSPAA